MSQIIIFVLSLMIWGAGAMRQRRHARKMDVVRSRLPDCKTLCSESFAKDKHNNALPPTMTLDMYVPACSKQQSRKGTCVDSPPWDPNRGAYYVKPFALPKGETCASICQQKAKDKLSNPYVPLYATEYVNECIPKCNQYAQTWEANRGVYNDKPFALAQGASCTSLCQQKAQDKLSNPYAPLFASDYFNECIPKCEQYAQRWDANRGVYNDKPFALALGATCTSVCQQKAQDKLSNPFAPLFVTEYVNECLPKCNEYAQTWIPSQGVYFQKPFALAQGATCTSVCQEKAQDKLSNPYAPLFTAEYVNECLPKCNQHARTWDANRGVYNDKPFALAQGATCSSVCQQKAQDKLSNPYTPLFTAEYFNECLPKCNQHARAWDANRGVYNDKPFALAQGATCTSLCQQKAQDKLSNPYVPLFVTEYVNECLPKCEKYAQRWNSGRGSYYSKPFALSRGQTCSSVCQQKAQDKLSNPYAPLFEIEYVNECLPKCNKYAQTWDANRGVFNNKPFELAQGATCKSVCQEKAQDKLSNPYAPIFAIEYVNECLPNCEQYAQTWDASRGSYHDKPFALPQSQSCSSVCQQKAQNKLSNPYAPLFATEYVNECRPRCEQYAQSWDASHASYYRKPFTLPPGHTCTAVCQQKAQDKLSNPYAPLFATEYYNQCMPTCEQYASPGLPDCESFCAQHYENDIRNGALPPTMTLAMYVPACTKQQSRNGACSAS